MATIQDYGLSIGAGVLHPQLAHKFMVSFKLTPEVMEYNENERKEVEAAIKVLQSQVVELQLPRQKFITAEGNNMVCNSDGHLHVVFEDDIGAQLSKAIFLLLKHNREHRSSLQIDVLYLDGAEGVTKTVSTRHAHIVAFVPGHLDYSPGVRTITGTITDPWREQPREGYQYTNQVNLSIPGHRNPSSRTHVSFDASTYITTFHV